MDKRNLLALVLITIIITGWLFWQSMNSVKQRPEDTLRDTTGQVVPTREKPDKDMIPSKSDPTARVEEPIEVAEDTTGTQNPDLIYGRYFSQFASGKREIVTIETELVKAVISSKGATILRWELKDFKKWDGEPTQLLWEKGGGQLYPKFLTSDAKKIDTRNLFFELDNQKDYYKIKGDQKLTLTAKLDLGNNKSLIKRYTFHGNTYTIDTEIKLENLDDVLHSSRGYEYYWSGGLRYQEKNSVDESNEALVMASLGGEIEEIDASDIGEDVGTGNSGLTGRIEYTAIKTKYFTAAIMPVPNGSFDGTVDLWGTSREILKGAQKYNSTVEYYDMSYRIPYNGGVRTDSFRVYIGPIDYDIVKDYGLEQVVNLGWKWIVRPIGEYFMLPIFRFIHNFIPNYGFAIIIFSLLMKILLYPLSIQQMQSARKMKLLAPEMEKLREKYKDDQSQQQKETMKLYSEYGINPAGGCLPLLLQMPILYALFTIMRTAIDLRQADFMLWITDLSVPDTLIDLGFKLPLIGLDQFSGLALLMGITLFFQQKLTITDPRQKAMVYMMPVMFTLMFSAFPAGLNLYYFVFNLFGIIQQIYINKYSKNQPTLADLKKSPKKEGWLQKKMREAQEITEARSNPGSGKPYQSKKKKKSGGKK